MKDFIRHNFIRVWWRIIDQQTMIALIILSGFSLMLVATASPAVANRIGLVDNYFLLRHFIFLLLSMLVMIIFSFLDKKWIRRFSILGFLLTLIMLILVKLYGFEVKGATRWINIFGFSYQPSEFMKPLFAVIIGFILSLQYQDDFPGFRVSLVLFFIVAGLLITQPDFGMLVMISVIFGAQLFVAGLPVIWISIAVLFSLFGVVMSYMLLPHVASRINNFLKPAENDNYQINKSLEAFESGGLWGKGPGEGTVKQFLPDSHTDFIFAVAGEEFGAIICLMIILMFAYIVIRVLVNLLYENDKFVQIASIGIITQFGLQSFINIGVTLNLLPTKGMTLPFISYGGSSMLAISMGMGMLIGLNKKKASLIKYKLQDIDI